MSILRNWLLGVTAAALAVSLAQALTPDGAVKKVGRLVGGLVLLLAVTRPLMALDPAALAVTAAAYTIPGAEEAGAGGEEVLKTLIAQKAGAYIVDKGRALGLACEAEVTVTEDDLGWPVPWSVTVTGTWTEEQERLLSQVVWEDLAIPAERQDFQKEGV